MRRYTPMLLLILLFSFLAVQSSAQRTALEHHLLIGYNDPNQPGAVRLFLLDISGNETAFTSTPVDAAQIIIAPDHNAAAARDADGNIIVLDRRGEVKLAYAPSNAGDIRADWQLWGWANAHTLIASSRREGLRFFSFSIDGFATEPQPVEMLNALAFFQNSQHIAEIEQTNRAGIDFLLRFSPDFTMLLTPPFILDHQPDLFSEDDVLVWHVAAQPDAPVAVITNTLPWWYRLTASAPAWSPDGTMLIAAGLTDDPESAGLALYLYRDFLMPPARIAEVECYAALCDPNAFAWSPDQDNMAYWITPFPLPATGANSRLILLDLTAQTQRTLLETEQWRAHLFWSPDGALIAFQEAAPAPGDQRAHTLRIINPRAEAHSIRIELPQSFRLYGWLARDN